MADNGNVISEATVNYWKGFLSEYRSPECEISYCKDISSKPTKFSFSEETSNTLLSIANGSNKRLSILLTSLSAYAQAIMLKSSEVTVVTGNYLEDSTEPKILCLPFNFDSECTLKDVIVAASTNMQQKLAYSVESFQNIFDSTVTFPLSVILKNCQKESDEFSERSLSQLLFEHDSALISCEVTSIYDSEYVITMMNMVESWASKIRSDGKVSELLIPDPFFLNVVEAENGIDTEQSILALFKQQVGIHPAKTAIADGVGELSYAELDKLSDACAIGLIALGIERGDTIGIHMSRSCSAIVAMFAVLKAGGKYCPFDINWPVGRKKYVLDIADMRLVISSIDTRLELEEYSQIIYDNLRQDGFDATQDVQLPEISGQDSAYVIFTSGSTGNPKGVEIPHRAVVNLVKGLEQKVYRNYPWDLNVSMISALSFDASVQQMYPALLLGHTLHIVPDEVRKDGKRISQFWRDRKIHIADCTPTHLRMIRSQMNGQRIDCQVKHLMIGGEKLERQNWLNFAQCWASVPNASNAYGPTECCVQSLSFEFNAASQINTKTIPIGLPMSGEEIVLIDEFMRILPKGAVGEIAISGKGLAKGYLNNVQLSQESFIFINGKRYYRTGDLARYIGQDGIIYLGRIDSQVKINGYRIELGEIEKVMQQAILKRYSVDDIKPVVDVHVTVKNKESGNQLLIAYICSNEEIDCGALRKEIASHLPGYMIPAYFITVDSLPQNSSGKIDNAKLPDPRCDVVQKRIVACNSETEQQVLDIWADLLSTRKENISLTDNFFDLGGSSFKLAQLSFKLSEVFDREIEVVDLFQYTTIQSQAKYIDENEQPLDNSDNGANSTEQFDEALKIFGL
ncbi:amino acid adenylation domain-containing protein [Photorhabdus luminescens subsp. sonorensis]|uniref:Amino acid adenylation domain-containing protein n=2 Tax=Photorhabdus luminescens TaxID=29488 RepID=A0A5C4RM89_PHOLU|nr:amino acid adenylation domain-containing protein [Photorhabdus luminescens subsp. sonorensis]